MKQEGGRADMILYIGAKRRERRKARPKKANRTGIKIDQCEINLGRQVHSICDSPRLRYALSP